MAYLKEGTQFECAREQARTGGSHTRGSLVMMQFRDRKFSHDDHYNEDEDRVEDRDQRSNAGKEQSVKVRAVGSKSHGIEEDP